MDTRDIRAFVHRDWRRVDAMSRVRWIERKRRLGAIEGLRMASKLRDFIVAQRPDWPSPDNRRADLAAHRRLAERLRVVPRPR